MSIELKLKTEKNFIQYLKLLKEVKYDYVIFIAVCDTAVGQNFPKESTEEFKKSLKLKTDLRGKFRLPYVAIINKGKVIKEVCADSPEKPINIEGSIKDLNFKVKSRGYFSEGNILGGSAKFEVNDKVWNAINRGLYFLIFDPTKNEVVDYCAFDGYDNLKCIKPYEIESDLKKFIELNPDVKLILFNSPTFPSNIANFTDNEKLIINENIQHTTIVKNAEYIFENKLSPLCDEVDTLEEFKEIISTPKSYVDIDGSLKFEDTISKKVNCLNGIRVTTDQPSNPRRAIFVVGQCTTFCVGADDSQTIESYLQRKINAEVPSEKFIVFNYGFFCGVIWFDKRQKLIDILNSLPVKSGDIVLLRYDAPLNDIPLIDMLNKSERPHNYGEIFYAKTHYTSNGYRLIADSIYDYLIENNILKECTKFDRGGGIAA